MLAHALIVGILWGPGCPEPITSAQHLEPTYLAPAAADNAARAAGAQQPGPSSAARPAGTSRATSTARDPDSHVRPLTVDAAALLDAAEAASATVGRLLAALEGTDVIVLVELRYRPDRNSGSLHLLGSGHGIRWLRVVIDRTGDTERQIGYLAHELQHATEIAGAPEVQDGPSLQAFYKRIGEEVRPLEYETAAACEVGRQAWLEALAARKGSRRRKSNEPARAGLRRERADPQKRGR